MRRWLLVALGVVELIELPQLPLFIRAAGVARDALDWVEFWIGVVKK